MIEMLLEDTPEGHCWKVTCDNCGTSTTYWASEDIKEWKYKKLLFLYGEKHFCPACK